MRVFAGIVGGGLALGLMGALIVLGAENPFGRPFKVRSGEITYEISRPGAPKTTQTLAWDNWGEQIAQEYDQIARVDGKKVRVRVGNIVTAKQAYGYRQQGEALTLLPEGDTMARAAMGGVSARELVKLRTNLARRFKSSGDDMVAGVWCNMRERPRDVAICAYKNVPVRVVMQTPAGEIRVIAKKARFDAPVDPTRFALPGAATPSA